MQTPHGIRRMKKTDAPAIARMMKKLASFHGDKINPDPGLIVKYGTGQAKCAHIWVACVKDKPVGFIESYYFANLKRNLLACLVDYFFVEEKYRKRGVGKALFLAASRDSLRKGCRRLYVGAQKKNKESNAFYRKLGMNKYDNSYNEYAADEALMKKWLENKP